MCWSTCSSIPAPRVRAADVRSLAQVDPQAFVSILSGLDPDPDWRVRAALATALGTLPADSVLPRLRAMLKDSDQRVVAAVLPALAKLHAPEADDCPDRASQGGRRRGARGGGGGPRRSEADRRSGGAASRPIGAASATGSTWRARPRWRRSPNTAQPRRRRS